MAQSVVDDHGEYKSPCGYCRSKARSSISHGMYARQMSVEDYQDLIGRGWRRSGNFLYKPAMDRTCCPPYTIRLDVNDFVPSKEQKAVLRRMERYLGGDYEVSEAPKGRPAGGRLSAGRETAPAEQTRRQRLRSAESSKQEKDHLDVLRRATEGLAHPSELSQAEARHSESLAASATGKPSRHEESQQGPSQSKESIPDHPQQIDETPAQLSNSLDIQGIRSLVEQSAAELLGSQCMVPMQVRRVPQKVRRKLSRGKGEGDSRADEELIYTSNAAFLLAAPSNKKRISGKSPGVQITDAEGVRESSKQSTHVTDMPHRVASQPSMELTGSAEIAEALAKQLQVSLGKKWRVEACRGHLNFYAPAGSLASPQGTVPEREVTSKKQHNSNRTAVAESRSENGSEAKEGKSKRKHFEMKMSRSKFDREEYLLYRKYQIRVHNDAPNEVSETNYRRFLVDSPLMPSSGPTSTSGREAGGSSFQGFGSFHQQYRIDGRLVAVGVVDILPHCLSSKYLFWDPDLAPLSLGKFSALKEIEWVRNAQRACPSLRYYYLGFYIHNCAKMRYKAAYSPSQLLCPLHFQWVPYSSARHVLDEQAYADLCRGSDSRNGLAAPCNETGQLSKSGTGSGTAAGGGLESKGQEEIRSKTGVRPLGEGAAKRESLQKGSAKAMSADSGVDSMGKIEKRKATLGQEENEMHGAPSKGQERGKAPSPRKEEKANVAASNEQERENAPGETEPRDTFSDGQESEESASDEGMGEVDSSEAGDSDDSGERGSVSEMQEKRPGAASMDELGTIPLLMVDTVIPFQFFHQLELMPEGAIRAVVARLHPYYAVVGPELASRLLYALG